MGLLLYSIEFLQPLPNEDFRRLLDQLPAALQPRILRYRRWEDAHANLLGKHLLRLALEKAGTAAGLDELQYTPENKPYIPGAPHFNISHSGNRVVCLLSTNGRVGIDIEVIHPIGFHDFQTQFTTKEWTTIHTAPEPVTAFYRFWTAKESLIKADGRGLQIPLLQLDVSDAGPIHLDGATWQLRPLAFFPGYAAHIAFEETPDPDTTFHELSAADLLAGGNTGSTSE
jgi:4'-phosphopantetheinyl transferase